MKLIIARYKRTLAVVSACAAASALLAPSSSWADKGLASLKTVAVPKPANLALYVANETAAIQLGKALFWDMQAGGDGFTACASCHFQAGADNRTRNQINPHGDAFNSVTGPNADLTASVFPITTNDVVGSAGVIKNKFAGLSGSYADLATYDADGVFNYNGFNIRQVTGRNAPSVINAVYNFRNFWDGRAREVFNGVNPFGAGDPNARVLQVDGTGTPVPVAVSLDNASLASQAVGPPNNSVEMSWNGRKFPQLGRKLLPVTPLSEQTVHSNDSVLGGLSLGQGLNTTYAAMVQAAFQRQWWQSSQCVDATLNVVADSPGCPTSFTVMESNFSLFWGLAIQLYEATLRADDTPFDRFQAGSSSALTTSQKNGLNVFTGQGRCVNCHKGAELTKASVAQVRGEVPLKPDEGFFNTAVRPIAEDAGSVTLGNGNFKTSHLRNVELTGPYFHNGEAATLRQVVEFYNRGGDFRNSFTNSQIRPLGLSATQKTDLVNFLLSLTDARVKNESKPFDHPSLTVNNGHNADGTDSVISLPAVGAAGGAPLKPFLDLNPQQP